ncbi:radical SAM peptide maturase [uncultured Parabacteroides sp.]|uniref:radical SAM peptide maturase n=1 Tax=uncultured Parabacteroides sp. TaxID=512312 RepID=UPI00262FAAC2|nr:radical SAM peptide maturase [uncultured Parabacteroides sp.]
MSILVHPQLKKVHEKITNCEKLSDIDSYYRGKYEYLKKHGFFSKPKPVNFGVVNEMMIKNNMIELPQVVFETTDFCNLNCTYCALGDVYEGHEDRNQRKNNIDQAVTLLKYIFSIKHRSKRNQLYIGFFGGEPLLNGEFIRKVVQVSNRMGRESGVNVKFNITTNATLLDKYISFLVENQFELLISLDGNEINHSYRNFRGNKKNSFSKVIENIDAVYKKYPKYFEEKVNFNAVLHKRNSVKDIYKFIYFRYCKIPRIAELNPCDINPSKKNLFNDMFRSLRESEDEYLNEKTNCLPHNEMLLYKELIDFLKDYSINYYVSNIMDLLGSSREYIPTATCLPFWKKVMLTTKGELTLCEKVSSHKMIIGRVGKKVEIDISKIKNQYNDYFINIQDKCQNCYANKSCKVCLFVMKNTNLCKLDSEEFKCDYFHDLKIFSRKLNRMISFLEKYPEDNSFIIENVVIV